MPRILVVEDSPTQAEELRLLLEGNGFEAAVARDGPAALDKLAAGAYDLVLSDVLMPDLSGYDLCRQIKTDPQTKHTPVVLLTQLTDPLDILHGLACGADNFFTKPFDPAFLVGRLRKVLDNSARRAAGAVEPEAVLTFRGSGMTVTADKAQILDLLLATVEEFIRSRAREEEGRIRQAALERRAIDLAEDARRKDEFLAVMAHELRNPLAPLVTSLHLARSAAADGPVRERALATAERQARHLGRLVDDLMDAARVARGQVCLRPERLDLARLARATAEDRRPLLEGAGLTLRVDVPDTPVWVTGDPTRLTQALGNLLDNAQKFSDRGGSVEVRLEAGAGRRLATLTVRDEGVGIAPADLSRLFEPLAQAGQGLDRPRGGLGLGLVVVKGLMELHGGTVTAASEGPGRGTVLTLRLPVQTEPAALSGPAASPARARVRQKVLLIEDNRDAADSLRELLTLLGHEAQVAYTGADGLAAAAAFVPDVVVSDIGLPGLDGFEVARRLRQLPGLERVLLVALTGYGDAEDRRLSREAGFDYHLVKPADPADLQRLLVAPPP